MIKVWHCYHYGPSETYIILAESENALKAKIMKEISAGWYPEDDGPLPDDFDAMMELYDSIGDYHGSYFGDFGWSIIDAAICEKEEAAA